jgi:hypothetical protein
MSKKTFSSWYAENRERLSERRKAEYAADPAKRQRQQEYQREYRTRTGQTAPQFEGLTRADLCDSLEITPWTLNSWRQKGFYPDPKKIGGRVAFSEQQMNLIGLLADFHRHTGPRLSAAQKANLNNIVAVVHANWDL